MTGSLDLLPVTGSRRVAVRVTRDALRQLRGGSPWLYDGSITATSHDGAAGDLAVVFDERRRFAAIGLWDPTSPIRVRLLHVGSPTPIDAAFWRARLDRAGARRAALAADPSTDAYRVVHGENDGLPGLVIDRYGSTAVVKLYSAAWFPHLGAVLDVVDRSLGPERVVLRFGRSVARRDTFGLSDGDVVAGVPVTGPVVFRERGLELEADVVRGQKTGHFLDQRDNRALVRSLAADRDVLDVFAGTGGFSLSAAAGGARSVHLIDRAAPALATAERNFARNRGVPEARRCRVRTSVGDAFDVLGSLGERPGAESGVADLVVVDPPSFAATDEAVPRAVAAYRRLTRLAAGVVRPGGVLVMASCSARIGADQFAATVLDAAARAGATVDEIRRTGHPVDHPIGFAQGAYLKAIYLRVRRPASRSH